VGNDDDVEPRRDLVTTENLSYQSFGAISLNRAAQFLRRRDTQASDRPLVREDKRRGVAAANPHAPVVHALEFGAPSDSLGRAKRHSLLTVRRFRPFARRRLSTRRPFLSLMRTRNP